MNSKLKKFTSVYGIGLICVLLIVLIVANYFALIYAPFISLFLGQETTKRVEVENASELNTNYFTSAYSKQSDLYKDQTDYAVTVQHEGSVLLKNAGLPLAKGGRISLLGSGVAKDYFLVSGGGSGSIDTSKTPTLKEVFEDAGFTVNDTMWNFYSTGAGKSTRGDYTVGEAPLSAYTDIEKNSFKDFNDAAIIVFGRLGGEGRDVATQTMDDPDRSMLELSKEELDLVDLATENFKNVVILLNVLNPIELGPIMDKNASIIWISAGGQQGIKAIPGILDGTYNPSGKLIDTFVYDNFSAPAMINSGDFSYGNYSQEFGSEKYLIYQEGIYIGYKYYETRYEDVVLGQGNAGDYNYNAEVAYPFGFGLSYTTFSHTGFSVNDAGDHYEASVTVTNTGTTSGKDVVEVYLQSPYTDYDKTNGVEKSAVSLAGFGKTKELAPNESEKVTVSIPKEYLRSYDASGVGGYIIEEGSYYIALGTDAHDAINNILAAKGKTQADGMTANGDASNAVKFEINQAEAQQLTNTYNRGANGEVITNALENVDIASYDSSIRYLSRSDWRGTWPDASKALNASEELIKAMDEFYPNLENVSMPVTGAKNGLSLIDMRGLPYDSEEWEPLLDEITVEEMQNLICNGAYSNMEVGSINKNKVLDKDGPAGISATLIGGRGTFGYPVESLIAATWNVELAERMGALVGEDGLLAGVSGWYAPGINMHRTPFSGRNFEYYSEDPFISGAMSAAVTKEAQRMGLYTYSKHFALNDQELFRNSVCVYSNEQAAREIYLRPFEMNVRDGGSHGIMVSMNRVGPVWSGANKGLVGTILRDEWGFEGCVVTDASSIGNTQMGLYAGTNLWLGNGSGRFIENFKNDAGVVTMMREATHGILYAVVNSNAMNGIAAGTTFIPITPMWQVLLYVADAILGLVCIAGIAGLVYTGFIKEKRSKTQVQAD